MCIRDSREGEGDLRVFSTFYHAPISGSLTSHALLARSIQKGHAGQVFATGLINICWYINTNIDSWHPAAPHKLLAAGPTSVCGEDFVDGARLCDLFVV